MSDSQLQPDAPQIRRWQFSLRTLLLLFLVLASSLAVFGAWGVAVFAFTVVLAIYLHEVESLPSLASVLLIALCLLFLIGLLLPAFQSVRESGRQATCQNNLKQVVLALLNYESAKGCFPPAYIADKSGKPMQSWRALILPYLDLNALCKSYNSNEPWDGPNNRKLLAIRVPVYVCPSDPSFLTTGPAHTSYVAVVGPGAAWEGGKSRKLSDFGNNASHTVMLIEVANSGIAWSEPRDFALDSLGSPEAASALKLSSDHGRQNEFIIIYDDPGVIVALADGSVHFLRTGNRSPDDLGKLLQIGGFSEEEEEKREPAWRLNWPNIAALAVWLLSVGALLRHAVRSRTKPLRSPAIVQI